MLAPQMAAQTQVFVFDTRYKATNLGQWGAGSANGVTYDAQLNGEFKVSSQPFGGFGYGLFGDEWGAGGTASIAGGAGFNFHFKADGGSINVDIPNRVSITVPSDNTVATPTINITQNRSALGGGDLFTSIFPNLEFSLGAHYFVDARIDGRVAYGVGSTTGSITLLDMLTVTNPHLALSLAQQGIDPFNMNYDRLLAYNLNSNQTLTIVNNDIDLGDGITKQLTASDFVTVKGYKLPTTSSLGSITVNPTYAGLNAASGSLLKQTVSQPLVFGASLDILGAVSSALGLPFNPFDMRGTIPGTPIEVVANILSLKPNIEVGLTQSLTLMPNTYLGLTSNYNVTYEYTDATGTHQVTSRDFRFRLPDDASASSLRIVTKPTESDWQLFSSVYIDPKLLNELFLHLGAGLDITALTASIGAYGASVGFGPLLDVNLDIGGDVLIYSALVDLAGGNLSRVYRNPIPIFGQGVLREFDVGPQDTVAFFSQGGSFNTADIQGSLIVRDAYFQNARPLNVSGLLYLDNTPTDNGQPASSSTVEVPQLFVASTGTVVIDPNNTLIVNGLQDGNGNYVLDATGAKQVGFVTPGNAAGTGAVLNTGTFILGGILNYDGPDILSIGSGATVELLPSTFMNETNPGWRFNNFGGQTDPDATHDGLRYLKSNFGTLIIAGQDLAVINGGFTNGGNMAVLNGYTFDTGNSFTNNAGATVSVGGGSLFTIANFTSANLASLTLSNVNLTLGDATTGGVFYYTGSRPSILAASSRIVLSGSRPSGGYLQTGGADALANLSTNAGTFRLQNGATQTVGGSTASGLVNTGTLEVAHAGSVLTVNGALSNSGTLTLASGGALTASGTLANLASGSLNGGTWNLGGVLTYTGDNISRLGTGTAITLNGAGSGLSNQGTNAFSSFHTLASGSSLTLTNGATLTTDGTVDLAGALTLNPGTTFNTGGLKVDASGRLNFSSTLDLKGALTYTNALFTGIAAGTTIQVGSGGTLTRHGVNGWAGFADVAGTLEILNGGTVRTDTALAFTGSLVLRAGGTLQATGASLALPANAFTQAGGTLILGGGVTQTSLALGDGFNFADTTRVQLGSVAYQANYANTTGSGQLTADATTRWSNAGEIVGAGAITGGTFTNSGLLQAAGGTLTLGNFAAPLVNTGTLRSYGATGHAATLTLDGVSLLNTGGSIEAFSQLSLLANTVINGGRFSVFGEGSVDSHGATLNVDNFELGGAMLVRNSSATSLTVPTAYISNTGSLSLETGATLAFGAGSSLINRGTLNYAANAAITGLTVQNYGTLNLGAGIATNLNNVANQVRGTINLLNGSTLNLPASGTFTNAGLIHLSGENPSALTHSHSNVVVTGNLTLDGGGTLQLGGYNTSALTTAADGTTAINVASTLWHNAGTGTLRSNTGDFKLTLANQQLIGAGNFGEGTLSIDNLAGSSIGVYGDGSVLNIQTNSGGFLNLGTLNVGSGSTMILSGGAFHSVNTAGALALGSYRVAGTLQINSLAGGAFDNAVALTFDGANAKIIDGGGNQAFVRNNLAAGSLTVANTNYNFTTTAGNTFSNQGLLAAAIAGTVNITGGYFTNFANNTLTGGRYDATGIIKFDGANLVTNAADITLRGSGRFENESGADALANFSTNLGTFSLKNGAGFALGSGVTTFNQNGNLYVGIGSTMSLGHAAVVNSGTGIADYWIGGVLTGGTDFNQANTRVTLYGNGAGWYPDNPSQRLPEPGFGRMTFAGGLTVNYDTSYGLMQNWNLWEIGSSTAIGPNGNTIRSGAHVTFAGTAGAPITIYNHDTIRYYGGAADDGLRGSLSIDHLRVINGGTFDASGAIAISAGGSFDLVGTLANSEGALDVIFATNHAANRFTVVGGLDLTHPVNLYRGSLAFTPANGLPIKVSGFRLELPDFDFATMSFRPAVIGLSAGATVVNRTTGRSALENLERNTGTMTFINANGIVFNGNNTIPDYTFLPDFTNFGTITASGAQLRFKEDVLNRGVMTGSFWVGGDFNNGMADDEAVFNGSLYVAGNLVNERLSTLNITGGVTGDFTNWGTFTSSPDLIIGGFVSNYGVMTINANSFRRPNNTFAEIVNLGTLHASGTVGNILNGDGDIHTTGELTKLNAENFFTGDLYVDSGSLQVTNGHQLGQARNVYLNASLELHGVTLSANTTLFLNHGSSLLVSDASTIASSTFLTGSTTIRSNNGSALNLALVGYNAASAVTITNTDVTLTTDGLDLAGLSGSGTLRLAHSTGDTTSLTLTNGSTLTGTIHLTGTNDTLTVKGSAFTSNVASAGTTTFIGNTALSTSGVISGTGSVNVADGMDLTLTNAQTYTGLTTIYSGSSLTLNGTNASLAGGIRNDGALIFNRNGNYSLGANVTPEGTGSYTQNGSGILTLLNPGFLSNLIVANGTVRLGDGSKLFTGTFSPITNNSHLIFGHAGSATVTVGGTGDLTHNATGNLTLTINGANANTLLHTGTGTLTLPAGQTFTGATRVQGTGTLEIYADSSLGAAPAISSAEHLYLNGGTLRVLGVNEVTLNANRGLRFTNATIETNGTLNFLTSPSGGFTKTGAGRLNIGMNASQTFQAVLNEGSLKIDNVGSDRTLGKLSSAAGTDLIFAGTGTTALSIVTPADIKGRLLIESGTLAFSGQMHAPTNGSLTNGLIEIAAAATLADLGSGTTFHNISGAGRFIAQAGSTAHHVDVGSLALRNDGLIANSLYANSATMEASAHLKILNGGRIGDLTLSGAQNTIEVEGAYAFNIDGTVTNHGFYLDKTGNGELAFDGATINSNLIVSAGFLSLKNHAVLNGVISGAGTVYIGGGNVNDSITFTRDQTYTGGTFISLGELVLGNGGSSGSVQGTINTGNLYGYTGVKFNRSDDFTLNNTLLGNGWLRQAGTNTITVNRALASAVNSPLDSNRDILIDSGTVALTDGAAGIAKIVNHSALVFTNTGALALDAIGYLNSRENISGTGTVKQLGSGTTTLAGSNTYTGATTIADGKLVYTTAFANAGGITVGSANSALNRGTLGIAGAGNIGGTIANWSSISLDRTDDYVFGATTTGAGSITKNGAGTATLGSFNHTNSFNIAAGELRGFVGAADNATFNSVIFGLGLFSKTGSGRLTLTGGSNLNVLGGLHVAEGRLRIGSSHGYNTDITVAAGATLEIDANFGHARKIDVAGSLQVLSGNFDVSGAITAQHATTIFDGASLTLRDGGTINGTLANFGDIIFDYGFGHDVTFAATTTASSTGYFIQQGAGKITLTGENLAAGTFGNYQGGAIINAGSTLALAGNGSLRGTITNHGTLEISTTPGATRSIPANLIGSGNVLLSGGGTIEVGSLDYTGQTFLSDDTTLSSTIFAGDTKTFTSLISGQGGLTKTGGGTLVLTKDVALNRVIITEGTLALGNGGTTGYLAANSFINHGTLAFNFSNAQTFANVMSGQGGLHQTGAGTITIASDNPDLLGDTVVDAGTTLRLGNEDSTQGSVGGAIVANGTVQNFKNGPLTLDHLTGGADGLFQNQSTGTLTLTQATDFAGTLITAGALIVDSGVLNHRLDRVQATSLTNHGQLTITGNNTTVPTVTNYGTLTLGNGGEKGSLVGTIHNDGRLVVNRSNTVYLGSNLIVTASANAGIIRQIGTGTTVIQDFVNASTFEVMGGTLAFDYYTARPNAVISTSPGGNALFSGSLTHNNAIVGNGRITIGREASTDFTAAAGHITFSNATNTYDGSVHIVAGSSLTLRDSADPTTNDQHIAGLLSGGGDLNYITTDPFQAHLQNFGKLSLGSGSTLTGTLTTAGNWISSGGSFSTLVEFASAGTLEFTNRNAAIFSGTLLNGHTLIHNGSGALTLDTAFVGNVTVNTGAFLLGTNGSLSGTFTLANTSAASLQLNRATTLSSLNGGGTLGGNIALGTHTLTLDQASATTSTYAGALTGTGGFAKDGAGSVTLAGNNTFTGNITVSAGTLALAGTNTTTHYIVSDGARLEAASIASLGGSNSTFTLDLNGGAFHAQTPTTFSNTQSVTLDGGGFLSGDLTLNRTVSGAGALTINGGRVQLNGDAYSGHVVVSGATLVLGQTNAIDAAKTSFTGATLDLNGLDWSENLDAQDMTIASYHGRSAVSSTLSTSGTLKFDGDINFIGDITAPADAILHSSGNLVLGDTAAGKIGSLWVLAGDLDASASALNRVTSVIIGGDIHLGGSGTFGSASTDFAAAGGSLLASQGNSLTIEGDFNLGNGNFSVGGAGDIALVGSLGNGTHSLTKVGTGHVDLANVSLDNWDASGGGARLLINEGSLTATTAFLNNRGLAILDQGTLALADTSTNALTLRSLDGNGTLALGSRNLIINAGNSGAFTGSVSTTGSITNTVADISSGAKTQTFGSLTAGTLTVNSGNVVITDSLKASTVNVAASGASGSLTATTNGISNADHTALQGTFVIDGWLNLLGGQTLTTNAASLTLRTASARIMDVNGSSTFSHLASNTGTISLSNGASITGAASVFTNTGIITISGANWSGFNVINNQGVGGSNVTLTATTLAASRFNQISGTLNLNQGAAIVGTAGGNALNNPAFVLSGGTFNASGSVTGGILQTGGTFNASGSVAGGFLHTGGNLNIAGSSIGTFTVSGGVFLRGGSQLTYIFADNGLTRDHLQVNNTANTTDGKITLGAANATNPVLIAIGTNNGNLTGFTGLTDASWAIATTTDGFSNFDSNRFFVNGNLSTAAFGNYGVVTNGNNLELVYNPSVSFSNSSASETQSAVITATSQFGGVRISGANNAILNQANTYTGNTALDSGTLTVGHDQALGTGKVVLSGGTLRSDDTARTLANNIVLVNSNPVTLAGNSNLTFTGILSNFSSGSKTLTINNTGVTTFGDVNLLIGTTARTLTFNTAAFAGTTVISGTIANGGDGAGSLTKSGAGLLQLTGTNTYTGVTTISTNGGTLQLGNGGTTGSILGNVAVGASAVLSFNRSSALDFGGIISGAGRVTQVGPGKTTLTAANTYTGTTTISAGTLQFGKQVSLYNNNSANWTATNVVIASGATAAFNVGGAGEFTASNLDTIKSLGFASGSFLGLDTTNATNGTFSYGSDLTGAIGLTKLGTGTLALTGSNTYSGATNVLAGTLQLGSATALSPHTTLNIATGATFDSNGYAQAFSTLTGTGAINVGASGISVAPSGTNSYAGSLTGNGGLTMNGTGTLVLTNSTNNFSGPVTIASGTLEVGAIGALSSGLNVALANNATLALANHSTTVGALTGTGAVTLGSGTLTLSPSNPGTFAGSISGSGGVTVTGGGTVVLTGAHAYTGATNVTGASLVMNGNASASDFSIGNGGLLGGSGTIGDLTLTSGATLSPGNSPGTLAVDGNATWNGGANYNWQMQNATGLAGTGYDLVTISGSLTIAANNTSRFAVNVLSILSNDTAGDAINFSSAVDSSYTIASASGGVIGFNASAFTLNTTGFTNNLNGGSWNLSQVGNTISLNFAASAIPEPSTYAAIFGALVFGLVTYRKRSRR
ncbi:autotransporter-associated beta strand repeat-containing protein [Oleiharenicola lentus]|uniref:autotransporter-associated beta strand repeat-containing protein n=1 Tax=Oleiharenicola lentus TaxID=2508720 RepID=UPI003F66E421